MESIEPAREAGDGAGHREDDGLQRLNAVPEERHARLVDANAGECQPELRADEISTGGIDRDQGGQRQIIVGHALGELQRTGRHRRNRGNAVLPPQVVPAAREAITGIRAGQRPQRHERDAGRVAAEQQKGRDEEGEHEPDRERGRQDQEDGRDAGITGKQGDHVAGRPEEERLPEAHDAGEAPDEVEAERQQREDQHASHEDDPEVL